VSSLPKAIYAIYPLKQFGKDALNKNKPEDLPNEYISSFRVKSRDCKKLRPEEFKSVCIYF